MFINTITSLGGGVISVSSCDKEHRGRSFGGMGGLVSAKIGTISVNWHKRSQFT